MVFGVGLYEFVAVVGSQYHRLNPFWINTKIDCRRFVGFAVTRKSANVGKLSLKCWFKIGIFPNQEFL